MSNPNDTPSSVSTSVNILLSPSFSPEMIATFLSRQPGNADRGFLSLSRGGSKASIGSVSIVKFLKQESPEMQPMWDEIVKTKGQYANDSKILALCSAYEEIISFIASQIASGEYTFYNQSVSFTNEKTGDNYGNLARNVKMMLFYMQVANSYITGGQAEFSEIVLDLKASLLSNGHFNLNIVNESKIDRLAFSTDIPRHVIEQIVIYLKAIKNECRSRKGQQSDEFVEKILKSFSLILSSLK